MIRKIFLFLAMTIPALLRAQSYEESIRALRRDYKDSVVAYSHRLKIEDTAFFRFYDVDERYNVKAVYEPVNGTVPFTVATMHGGQKRVLKQVGKVYFNLDGAALTMYIYRYEPMGNPGERGDLFIPFTDRTNYKTTFQGGRYLDVDMSTLKNGMITLDFNKCYNPYTAYEKGYPYIIPPAANSLKIEIRAGEKIFGHNPGY